MLKDFPIRIPYTTLPFMQKAEGEVYCASPDSKIIDKKRQELEVWRDDLYGQIQDDLTTNLIYKACELTKKPLTDDIVDLALNFEEDIAILHKGAIQAVCFCFPSGWIPGSKVGHSLTQIHSNVADGQKLTEASNRIAETMAGRDCFKRYVWTIAGNNYFNQHPLIKSKDNIVSIETLYFRTETQTTMPLGDGLSSLFFVKVNMYPLVKVFENIELKAKILDGINSMTDSVLEYKGLRSIKEFLLDTKIEVC